MNLGNLSSSLNDVRKFLLTKLDCHVAFAPRNNEVRHGEPERAWLSRKLAHCVSLVIYSLDHQAVQIAGNIGLTSHRFG
jgi:hypothetical protein